MRKIGIIGGMSPESTAIYYIEINRLVNRARGGNTSAPLILDNMEFEQIVQCQKNGDWQQAGEILVQSAQKLQQAGAQAIVLATNTMHKVADSIQTAIDVPFLHILDGVAQSIHAQNKQCVGLLGTRFTMQDIFYKQGLEQRGIRTIMPDDDAQAEIHRIIFEELCVGKILPSSRDFYLQTIEKLAEQGAEAVILGCTEIGLLIQQDKTDLTLLDTTQIHVAMAVDFILNH